MGEYLSAYPDCKAKAWRGEVQDVESHGCSWGWQGLLASIVSIHYVKAGLLEALDTFAPHSPEFVALTPFLFAVFFLDPTALRLQIAGGFSSSTSSTHGIAGCSIRVLSTERLAQKITSPSVRRSASITCVAYPCSDAAE